MRRRLKIRRTWNSLFGISRTHLRRGSAAAALIIPIGKFLNTAQDSRLTKNLHRLNVSAIPWNWSSGERHAGRVKALPVAWKSGDGSSGYGKPYPSGVGRLVQ